MTQGDDLEGIGPGGAYEPESHEGKDWRIPVVTIVGVVAILAVLLR